MRGGLVPGVSTKCPRVGESRENVCRGEKTDGHGVVKEENAESC